MAASSLSLSLASLTTISKSLDSRASSCISNLSVFSSWSRITCSSDSSHNDDGNCNRRTLVLGMGVLPSILSPANPLLAEEKPANYSSFVDLEDGYSYYYPKDWIDFDFRGHDSAFKDRYLQLQNVRLSFIPTEKSDIHEMGPIDKVVYNLLKNVYSAPTQVPEIYDMQERTIDGKTYYTFEYTLTSPNFGRSAFTTVAVGNGRYYTLIVGANERRWKRVRNQLKVVADSFRVLDI